MLCPYIGCLLTLLAFVLLPYISYSETIRKHFVHMSASLGKDSFKKTFINEIMEFFDLVVQRDEFNLNKREGLNKAYSSLQPTILNNLHEK